MNRLTMIAGLAAALALPVVLAPSGASASCQGRRLTGTVIGGLGGALIGNSIARGGGGAVVGGLGGAVLGHQIAGSGCGRYRSSAYYGRPRYRSSAYYGRPRYRSSYHGYPDYRGYQEARVAPRAVRYVYYDQFGKPVSQGPAPDPASYGRTFR